jgi:hypothetical protein
MRLRVKAPSSPVLHVWCAPVWQRIFFPTIGLALLTSGLWPYAGEPYEPMWISVLVGPALIPRRCP